MGKQVKIVPKEVPVAEAMSAAIRIQSGWCFVEVGHIKEFDIGDSAAFNGKLLDGTGVFVKFHCHILQMPV